MSEYLYDDDTSYVAKDQVDGVLIDPELPPSFDDTPNEERPEAHQKWWDFPFIRTQTLAELDAQIAKSQVSTEEKVRWRAEWLKSWPHGTRYDVRCLDGGAWDRSTGWGMFPTLEEAVRCAKSRRLDALRRLR